MFEINAEWIHNFEMVEYANYHKKVFMVPFNA